MTRPPAPRPDVAPGILAIGELLFALLAALLGLARAQPRAAGSGAAGVWVAISVRRADTASGAWADQPEDWTLEPAVEWIAVPAPWRAGRLLPPWVSRPYCVAEPRLCPRGRGPPMAARCAPAPTGMAKRLCAGAGARPQPSQPSARFSAAISARRGPIRSARWLPRFGTISCTPTSA